MYFYTGSRRNICRIYSTIDDALRNFNTEEEVNVFYLIFSSYKNDKYLLQEMLINKFSRLLAMKPFKLCVFHSLQMQILHC